MKNKLIKSAALLLLAVNAQSQVFTTLTGGTIEWPTSNYGAGFANKIYDWDYGNGHTALHIAGRHNSPNWVNIATFNSDGNVGIGTSDPLVKLEIVDGNSNATSYIPLLKLRSNNWQCSQQSGLEFWNGSQHTTPTARIISKMEACTGSGDALVFETMNAGTFGSQVTTPKLIIANDGQTSINSYATDAFVINDVANSSINFKVKSSGTVYAREIFVQLGVFPDYVFSKNYSLMDLDKVKEHISHHHRLPNMPSAEEVKLNGANLGEIQRLTVEKVEELYLHMIRINEELEKLKKENETLRKK